VGARGSGKGESLQEQGIYREHVQIIHHGKIGREIINNRLSIAQLLSYVLYMLLIPDNEVFALFCNNKK
jgi:hypothetical protein